MVKRLLFIVLCILAAQPVWAGIAHDVTTPFTANNASSVSGTHTPVSTTNGIAMICVTWQNGTLGTLNSVTYGGNAATLVDGQTEVSSGQRRAELWRYVGPVGGGSTVTATMDGTKNDIRMHVSTYTGVHQSTPLGTPVKDNQFSTTPTVTVSSAAGEMVVDCGLTSTSAAAATVGAGQTQRANFGDNTNHLHFGSEEGGSASTVMSWTITLDVWASIGVALKPAPDDQPAHLRGGGVPGMNSLGLGGPLP